MENIKFYITNTLLLIIAIGIITYVATSIVKQFEKEKVVYFCEYYDWFGRFDHSMTVMEKPLDSFTLTRTNPRDGKPYKATYYSKKTGHLIKDGIKIESYVIRENNLYFEGGETLPLIDQDFIRDYESESEKRKDTTKKYNIDFKTFDQGYINWLKTEHNIGNVNPAEPPKE